MNQNSILANEPDPASLDSARISFQKLFASGVTGWLVGMVGLFGASWLVAKPECLSVAALWMVSHWWVAFLVGLLAILVRGLAARQSLRKALLAYLLPVAVLSAIVGLCLWVYPEPGLREDLFTYLAVVVVFYIFAALWMAASGEAAAGHWIQRAVLPPLVGGALILGFVAVPAFASDAFTYRKAFQFKITKTSVQGGKLISEGTLEILKPGTYEFSAPRYLWQEEPLGDDPSGPTVESGDIQWESGVPKPNATGVFPLRIVWIKGVPTSGSMNLAPLDDSVALEVRRPDQGGKLIYSMSVPMELE